MINTKEENIAQKVFDIISSGKSVCEKVNPRGVCCTEDVTSFLTEYGIDYKVAGSCGDSSCGTSSSSEESSCFGTSSLGLKFSLNPKQTSSCC